MSTSPILALLGQPGRTTGSGSRSGLRLHVADTLAATRSKALQRPASERTPEALAVEREIRDRLMEKQVDPLMVGPQYFAALERGDDVFVRAVENAPSAFPLLTPEERQRGQEIKIEQSPLASEIAEQEAAHDLFRQIVATTRTELGRLAERHRTHLSIL